MHVPIAMVALVIGIAGCAGAQQAKREAEAALLQRQAECRAAFPGSGHAVDRVKCWAAAWYHNQAVAGAYPDLTEMLAARGLQLAMQVDANRMTTDEALAAFAHYKVEANQIAGQRNHERAMADAAVLSALAPMLMQQQQIQADSYNAGQQRMVEIFKAGQPRPFNPPTLTCNQSVLRSGTLECN